MRDLLDGLNRAQRAAVTHPGGPLVVIAGAGTGKTRTVTARFASLIQAPYEDLHVSTFHAFCSRLLADEALEVGLDPFFSPVTPADRLALLLDRLDELSLRHHEIRGNPAPLLASFVARIDRLKEEMVTADELLRHAERLAAEAGAA